MVSIHNGIASCDSSNTTLANEVSEADIREVSGIVARRLAVAQGRANGKSWSQSRRESLTAKPSAEVTATVRASLKRGESQKEAIAAAIAISTVKKGAV